MPGLSRLETLPHNPRHDPWHVLPAACQAARPGPAARPPIGLKVTGLQIGVMFGNPETTSGGMALKYFALQRIDLRRKASIPGPKDKEPIGITVKAKVRLRKVKVGC